MAPVCIVLSPGIRPARSQCFTDLQQPASHHRSQYPSRRPLTSSAPFDGQLINIELPWWYNSPSPQARQGHVSPGRVETLSDVSLWPADCSGSGGFVASAVAHRLPSTLFSGFSAHGIGQTTRDSRKIQHDHGARSAKSTANMPFAVPGVDKVCRFCQFSYFGSTTSSESHRASNVWRTLAPLTPSGQFTGFSPEYVPATKRPSRRDSVGSSVLRNSTTQHCPLQGGRTASRPSALSSLGSPPDCRSLASPALSGTASVKLA